MLEQIYVEDVTPRLNAIEESLAGEHKMSMSDIKGNRLGLLPIVWVGIILAVLQQFVGINAVFYYSNLIWGAVGFDESRAFFTSTIISAVNVIFTFVAIALIDRMGRKPLLLIGSAGMFVTPRHPDDRLPVGAEVHPGHPGRRRHAELHRCLGAEHADVVVVQRLDRGHHAQHLRGLLRRDVGPDRVGAAGEMFPNKIRAAAMSVGVMANWIANFIVSRRSRVWSASRSASPTDCSPWVPWSRSSTWEVRQGDKGRTTRGHGVPRRGRDRQVALSATEGCRSARAGRHLRRPDVVACSRSGHGHRLVRMSVHRVMGIETEYGIRCPVGRTSTRCSRPHRLSTPTPRTRWGAAVGPGGITTRRTPARDARGYDLSRAEADPSQLTDEDLGLANVILTNGARLYVDHAHPEYSTPEVTNPFDAVPWDKAGERIMARAAGLAATLPGAFPCSCTRTTPTTRAPPTARTRTT